MENFSFCAVSFKEIATGIDKLKKIFSTKPSKMCVH